MRLLRRSKSSGDVSASALTFPANIVRKLAFKRKSKVPAVSSSSIALPIGSPSRNIRGTSTDGGTSGGRDSGWQTAYATARMAVDIAKESSDMFPPLKAVVGAISVLIQNCDRAVDNAEAVKDIEQRVHLLSSVLLSPVSKDDHAEKARRMELQRKLERVLAKLEPLSKEHALLGFLRNVDNAKVLTGFVQDLANAVTDYQISIQQGTYEKAREIHEETRAASNVTKAIGEDTRNILGASEVEILSKLEPVPNAGYQSGHHEKCLPGTRESVLRDILLWAKTPQGQSVFWLNGVAGSGKSTIAQSISEKLADDGLLGASFFCSRDYLDRRELKNIFPTLAHQLACRYPQFRNHVINIVKEDPTKAHSSLVTQLNDLLVKPLSEENLSCIIVIDALDECIDDQPASAILSVLARFAKELPLVKFFITGRPEPRIRTGFRLPFLEPLTRVILLHEVISAHVDKDIRLYLTQKLTAIAQRRSDVDLPNPWPSENEIVALTTKSSGLFIFASTIVRFIESDHHQPTERLKLILSQPSDTAYEGRSGVDSLYTQILAHAFPDTPESEVFVNINRVLGSIILAFNPLSRRELSTILGTSASQISTTLRHLHSVILVPPDETEKIRVFHKSFPDFLQDSGRCTDPRFHIDHEACHSEMALGCLELVEKLDKNPCSLPPFTMNQDVRSLPLLLEDKLGGGVRYACSHWARHLRLSRPPDVRAVTASINTVLGGATPWIEVMSLENQLGEVIHSLNSLLHWLDNTAGGDEFLSQLATDYLRTAMYFFYPIQQCAQQVHTAILLSPSSSLLHNNQEWVAQDEILVTGYVNGPSNWGLLLTTISVGTRRLTSIATFAEKIAVVCEDLVNIYDAATFALEQSSHTPQPVTKIQGSEDGSILYCAHSRSVTSWDVQTGGLIDTFHTRSEIKDMAISPTDGHIACSLSDNSIVFRNYHTKKEGSFGNSESVVTVCWLSPAELVVATGCSVYVANIATGTISNRYPCGGVWCVVVQSCGEITVVTLWELFGSWSCILSAITYEFGRLSEGNGPSHHRTIQVGESGSLADFPISVGKKLVAITQPRGVVVLEVEEDRVIKPPSLKEAVSVAASLGRNLVAQTEDSVQIFSIEALTNEAGSDIPPLSHIYPLGKTHAVCLRPDRCLAVIHLGDLRELDPNVDTLPLEPLLTNPSASPDSSCSRGLVAAFGVSTVVAAWKSCYALPRRKYRWSVGYWVDDGRVDEEKALLRALSPGCTLIATLYGQPQPELQLEDAKDGTLLATLFLEDDSFWGAEAAYDLIFDSEMGFHLKVDGPGYHVQIPYDIIVSSPSEGPYTIQQRKAVPLSEPRATPPYTLDPSYEWVLDRQSRKICWIPPENMQRGNGGHFWTGTSLIMLGSDGIVRKLTFKESDY